MLSIEGRVAISNKEAVDTATGQLSVDDSLSLLAFSAAAMFTSSSLWKFAATTSATATANTATRASVFTSIKQVVKAMSAAV